MSIIPFEHSEIRKVWHNEQWYFSVIDIVEVLTRSDRPRKYWNDLKLKLFKEGSELSEKIGQLKLISPDGKSRETDVANIETLLRLIQSVPSPKAEPLKLWLAKMGTERIAEIQDPSLSVKDHMNEAELILTALAELSTRQIAQSMKAKGLSQNKIPAKKGGQVAKNARKELESKTGESVILGENFLVSSRRLR